MKLLIAIHGSHSQPEAMQAQRETWLRDLADAGVDYRYFLGQPTGTDPDVVYLDSPDGPIWEGHRRTLFLNHKTVALVRYALNGGYDYVFKCDDDTFVYVDRLLASSFEHFDYAGNMDRHHSRETGPYFWAQGGSGYWLSRRAMEIIAREGLTLVRAEDFAVGQVLAAKNGPVCITGYHDPRYIPAATEADCLLSDTITLHKVNPDLMRRLYARRNEL